MNNYIKDFFKDVLRHTHGLGIFEMAKVRGTTEVTEIETVDADKTVIVKGQSINPVPDFADAQLDAEAQKELAAANKSSAAKSAIGGIIGKLGVAAVEKWG